MSRKTLFSVAGLVLFCTMPLAAQDAVLGQLYGNGVHAYFSQDYLKAHEFFTKAIDGHTQDPRVYYFRGLALLKLGRPQEAEGDFKQGAKLESAVDPARVYNVARALERVQGSDRAKLETFRLDARMTVLQKAEKEHALRYQETVNQQRKFLQQQSVLSVKPPETPIDGSKAPDAVQPSKGAASGIPEEPFMPGDNIKSPEAKPEPATPPPGLEAPAEKPAKPDTDILGPGAEPAKPALPAPGGAAKPAIPVPGGPTKPPAEKDDPFGAGGDAAAPAAPAAPATGPAAPATGPAAPATGPAAPATGPAGPAKKPAAPKGPAAPGAEGDPFTLDQDAGKAPAPAVPAAPAGPPKKPDAPKAPAAEGDPFGP